MSTCRLVRWTEGSIVEQALPEVVIGYPEGGSTNLGRVGRDNKLGKTLVIGSGEVAPPIGPSGQG